jgi:hypothetical protein
MLLMKICFFVTGNSDISALKCCLLGNSVLFMRNLCCNHILSILALEQNKYVTLKGHFINAR